LGFSRNHGWTFSNASSDAQRPRFAALYEQRSELKASVNNALLDDTPSSL
jgi:hypothetical protein